MPGIGVLYSDGRMRPPDWRRENYQVWEAITAMFAEHLDEQLTAERWENEELKRELAQRAKARAAEAS